MPAATIDRVSPNADPGAGHGRCEKAAGDFRRLFLEVMPIDEGDLSLEAL
jgi:hypothetical protein